MMRLVDQLFLIQTRGITAEAVYQLVCGQDLEWERGEPGVLETVAGRQRALLHLRSAGLWRGQAITWPSFLQMRRLAALLVRAGVRLAWRGRVDYPEKLMRGLGEAAPQWAWLAGGAERLSTPACAMIGSRQSPPRLLGAARRLAFALSEAGVVVVSGMAAGADTAAHEGARAGRAGTLAIPAMGLLTAGLPAREMRNAECGMRNEEIADCGLRIADCKMQIGDGKAGNFEKQSWLGLDRPDAPFSAGLAIRRNDVIAALGDVMVLVASGLKGGSSYGVRWALRHGVPLFCFEAGAATPPANRSLLRAGLARPLPLGEPPEAWLGAILPEIEKRGASAAEAGKASAKKPVPPAQQLDWLQV